LTTASPVPDRSPAIETHGALVAIDQAQSRVAPIETAPRPPAEANEDGWFVALI
jgi:hypothetical protein